MWGGVERGRGREGGGCGNGIEGKRYTGDEGEGRGKGEAIQFRGGEGEKTSKSRGPVPTNRQ